MVIRKINGDYPYELLDLADPSREAVADYIGRGECWVADINGEVIGVYVMLPTRPFTAELVNLAVAEDRQGRGIGKALIAHCIDNARKQGYKKLEVGTATTGEAQIALYRKCGFAEEWIDRGFFAKHYDGPLYDNGVLCHDMIRLGMDL